MPAPLAITTHFFLQIAVILLVCRLLWPVLRRLGQVQVIAMMVAGFLLGPSVLGWVWPSGQEWLFPQTVTVGSSSVMHPNLVAIYVTGQLGLVLYMFLVGSSLKLDILSAHLRQTGAVSVVGVAAPLLLGGLVGWWLVTEAGYFTEKVAPWQGALFLASAVAITAFPTLAWLIYDSGLANTRLGTMALSCAAFDDACAWILLAAVVATTKDDMGSAYLAAGGALAYLLLMVFAVRRWLRWLDSRMLADRDPQRSGAIPVTYLSAVLLMVLAASWLTDYIGIYSVFGAFVAGAVMPRGPLLTQLRERFEPLVAYLLVPAFFIYAGLNTKLGLVLEPGVLGMALVVLVVSFAGKFAAIGMTARWQGMTWRESAAMGALANARGMMELILLNVGLSAGLISAKLYTILALMTIITTFAAGPIQQLLERHASKHGYVFGPTGEEPKPQHPASVRA